MRDVLRKPCLWCGRPSADAEDAAKWVTRETPEGGGPDPLPWEMDKGLCWRSYGFIQDCPGPDWPEEHQRRLTAEQRCAIALNREAFALGKLRAAEAALLPRRGSDSYEPTLPLPEVIQHLRDEVGALKRALGAVQSALADAYGTEEELRASLADARKEICRRVAGSSSVVMRLEDIAAQRGWGGLYDE